MFTKSVICKKLFLHLFIYCFSGNIDNLAPIIILNRLISKNDGAIIDFAKTEEADSFLCFFFKESRIYFFWISIQILYKIKLNKEHVGRVN